MRKFEINKLYDSERACPVRVTNRTKNFVNFEVIQHYGRFNEIVTKQGRAKIRDWQDREVFFIGDRTIEA